MLEGDKKLRDIENNLGLNIKDTNVSKLSYSKTDKLAMAVYMVTDIIDRDEPLRNKLRTLATDIIWDSNYLLTQIPPKIVTLMSYLDIASAMNIVSEMNCNILKKEFTELDKSVRESLNGSFSIQDINLSEFFTTPPLDAQGAESSTHSSLLGVAKENYGHTRLGVQKGSTLLKALSDKTASMSFKKNNFVKDKENFDLLRTDRRNQIMKIIKASGGDATIKDIRDYAVRTPKEASLLANSSEKTLQRELAQMTKEGVLKKTGEKRWSRYFLKT